MSKLQPAITMFIGCANGMESYLPFDETEGYGTRGNEYDRFYELETIDIPEGVEFSGAIIRQERMGVICHEGVRIMEGTLIRGGYTRPTVIGRNVEITGPCHIGHDVIIGDNSIITTGSVLGGYAEIGKNCRIRINAIVRPGVKIADNIVVGMGSVVTKDLSRPGVYFGNPAKYRRGHGKLTIKAILNALRRRFER